MFKWQLSALRAICQIEKRCVIRQFEEFLDSGGLFLSRDSLRFSLVLPSSLKPIISLTLVDLGQHLHPVLNSMLSLKLICIMFVSHVGRTKVLGKV